MSIEIEEVVDILRQKEAMVSFLLPHEKYALFLLGNLKNPHFTGNYFVARNRGKIQGVAAYFPLFSSCSLFTEDPAISREFAKVLREFPVKTLLGMDFCTKAAYEEFLKAGFVPARNPSQIFMELSLTNFRFVDSKSGGVIRRMEEKDVDGVILLHRFLHHTHEAPVQEEERERIRLTDVTYCMELDNKIVSTACSNGLAGKVFQILGVVTHPDYQRRGCAKAVCSHLIRHFEKEGAKEATLFTGHDNINAQRCYKALGFIPTCDFYMADFI
jgi:predicted GNAT family acetyltransferase